MAVSEPVQLLSAPPVGTDGKGARWKRWCSGPVRCRLPEGGVTAGLAVVVIGFRAQKGLVDAVASLLAQETVPEIVVVNSGGGDAGALLERFAGRIGIIDVAQPLRAGAARNIGIDASSAPYVAFLAGDCRAADGWVAARLAAHEKGARAVASAIAVPGQENAAALAAHLTLFGLRSPQMRPPQALRYGVSYARSVFGELGYFNVALRIAEDTDFAQRLGRSLPAAWVPAIRTIHRNPRTAVALAGDMFGRGRRAARRNGANTSIKTVIGDARQRAGAALRIGRDALGFDGGTLRRTRPYVALASLAYALGLARGAARLARGQNLFERAEEADRAGRGERAIALFEAAVALDPESVWFRLHCADAHRRQGSDGAAAHIRQAIALSAYRSANARRLAAWLAERQLHSYGAELAELVGYTLPFERELRMGSESASS
ncbi:glycosyltransferase family 2 protein [Pelagibacterium lacus]|uniref:Glycosyltransferase n=1 Tax=Pelagibacterium lacus TaxID=2282655 RepID=A0A369W851_9HYPH|nr:glycosyltransferase [Pelagibacterium lacus]RDE09540.1 glycosyltransferase [Pelagibacterium lacus]